MKIFRSACPIVAILIACAPVSPAPMAPPGSGPHERATIAMIERLTPLLKKQKPLARIEGLNEIAIALALFGREREALRNAPHEAGRRRVRFLLARRELILGSRERAKLLASRLDDAARATMLRDLVVMSWDKKSKLQLSQAQRRREVLEAWQAAQKAGEAAIFEHGPVLAAALARAGERKAALLWCAEIENRYRKAPANIRMNWLVLGDLNFTYLDMDYDVVKRAQNDAEFRHTAMSVYAFRGQPALAKPFFAAFDPRETMAELLRATEDTNTNIELDPDENAQDRAKNLKALRAWLVWCEEVMAQLPDTLEREGYARRLATYYLELKDAKKAVSLVNRYVGAEGRADFGIELEAIERGYNSLLAPQEPKARRQWARQKALNSEIAARKEPWIWAYAVEFWIMAGDLPKARAAAAKVEAEVLDFLKKAKASPDNLPPDKAYGRSIIQWLVQVSELWDMTGDKARARVWMKRAVKGAKGRSSEAREGLLESLMRKEQWELALEVAKQNPDQGDYHEIARRQMRARGGPPSAWIERLPSPLGRAHILHLWAKNQSPVEDLYSDFRW